MTGPWLLSLGAAALAAPMGLLAMVLACAQVADPAAKPLVEVRESGASAPRPHPAVIQIFADGLIKTLKGERRASQEAINTLLEQLQKLDLFRLDQATFDKEFKAAGEIPAGKRGGSGFITLLMFQDKQPAVQLSLNQPDQFAKSKAVPVRNFVKALHLIRELADPPQPQPNKGQTEPTP